MNYTDIKPAKQGLYYPGSDNKTVDGAGILIQIPHVFLKQNKK